MADPQPDPKSDAKSPASAPRRLRRAALIDAGLEAMSLAALAFVAVGFSAYAGRREISRELALAWLRDKGVEAAVELDDLDATGFAGKIRLGPKGAPVFSAERIEVAYDLASPWTGGKFALNTRAVRLVRPRLNVRLDQNGLNFGTLQPLIDEALKSPAEPQAPGPAILVEDARVVVTTPGGAARVTGDASLDDGKLLRFDGRVGPMHYATKDLAFDAEGMLVTARKRDDRLSLDVKLDLKSLSAGQADLTEVDGALQADLAYPDLKALSAAGPADVRLALRARAAEVAETSLGDVEANLAIAGLLNGDLKRGGLDGHADLHARAGRLAARGLDSRAVVADLKLAGLALTYDDAGARGSARTHLAATAERAVAGGTALSRAALDINAASLTALSDAKRTSLSGPAAISLRGSRVAVGGLGLNDLKAQAQGRFSAGTDGVVAAFDGRANSGGGMAGPDAERLAASLPNPVYAKAGAAALARFDLSAPALRLTMREGLTTVLLPVPIRIDAANGARATLSAPGGPLLNSRNGVNTGRLALTLAGGGLPELSLNAPNWRADASGLTSDLVVAGTLDVPPLEGLTGTLRGKARLAGDDFTLRLSGCTPLSARTLEMGEPPITHVKVALCPTAEPLIHAANGAWRAAARFEDGQAVVPAAEARIEGVAATFVGGGRGGFDQAQVRVTSSRLVEGAADKRFEPVVATGALALARGRWTGGLDAVTPDGKPLGRIDIRHDMDSGRGEAVIDASRLAFAKDGLQPIGLTPLASVARQAEGPASFTGRFAWDPKGMTSSGEVSTPGLNFTSPLGFVATLSGKVEFTSLAPLVSAPGQTLKVERIEAIVPLQTLETSFTLAAEALHMQSTTFQAAQGAISIEPIDVPLDGKGVVKGVINIAHLDLGELVAGSSLADKVKVEAIIDGRLPFEFSQAGFRFLDGKIYATQPGRLSIAREALGQVDAGQGAVDPNDPLTVAKPAEVNAIQDFAYQAMENLHFETLEAGVNSTDKGRLGIIFHIKGEHDPKVAEKARIGLLELIRGKAFNRRIPLPAKTPVDLTLDSSLNFDELIAAAKRAWEDAQARAAAPPSPAGAPIAPQRSDGVQP
ncbi:MAG: YdbH domain-containing protein [Caulobacter sp.]|nr:YdbH domain-containing protein [Caulobacter sp.]